MLATDILAAILDSLQEPILLADTRHIVCYMNRAALDFYDGGASLLGTSLQECHNEQSQQMMVEILAVMQAGDEERLITDSPKHRVYMRAVRDSAGQLLGYYERYAPPAS